MRTAVEIISRTLIQPDPSEPPEAQIAGPLNARNILAALKRAGFDVVDRRLLDVDHRTMRKAAACH
jgi:hypothetical protein